MKEREEIRIRVRLDAKQFRRFCAFDTFRVKRRHLPVLIVSAVLFTLALADLLFLKNASGTVAGLLTGLAIAVPMVVFGLYVIQIESQVSRQGLSGSPEVYALTLGREGVTVSGLHRSQGLAALPWSGFWAAYRRPDAIYLYASEGRAFILPEGQADAPADALWALLISRMGRDRCF